MKALVVLVLLAGTARGGQVTFDPARLVDLTHPFDRQTIYWPTAKPFTLVPVAHGVTRAGGGMRRTTSAPRSTGGHTSTPPSTSRRGDGRRTRFRSSG